MNRIVILGGTTEGRELAQKLGAQGIDVLYLAATEYGGEVIDETDHIEVRVGRLDQMQMERLWEREAPAAIVDATHPYAQIVKETLQKSLLKQVNIPFYRVERQALEERSYEGCEMFDSATACVQALLKTEGNIFLTTGSKDLKLFCSENGLRDRLIVRVIPSVESLQICNDNGLKGKQIIAMQGPFTKEMNMLMLTNADARILVMKESGNAGGEEERLEAAKAAGCRCFVIKRPEKSDVGQSLEAVYESLVSLHQSEHTQTNEIEEAPSDQEGSRLELSLIGAGCGHECTMTGEAMDAVMHADVVFGAPRLVEAARSYCRRLQAAPDAKSAVSDSRLHKQFYPYYLAKDIIPRLEEMRNSCCHGVIRAAILFSGDTGFYSGCTKLYQKLSELSYAQVQILPGVSSIATLSARIGTSWHDAMIISTHGIDEANWISEITYHAPRTQKIICITSGPQDVTKIGVLLARLESEQKGKYHVHVGFSLGQADEKTMTLNSVECMQISEPGLYTIMIINEQTKRYPIVPGLSNDAFCREEKVPMTKEEIRTLSICKLRLFRGAVVYDIGSGSGSVACEIAGLDPEARVYAIEKNDVAYDLIGRNIEHLGLSNVEAIKGMAPEILQELPAPTHVFIGGAGGELTAILDTLASLGSPMRVVLNAVTLETMAQMTDLSKKSYLSSLDVAQVQVSKARKVGNYHIMQGQNPVTIVSFEINASADDKEK